MTVNEKENRYETSVFAVRASRGRRGAATADVGHPRHDAALVAGRQAARVRARGREGRQGAAAADLSAVRWTAARRGRSPRSRSGAGNPVWSPDGTHIAFTSATSAADAKKSDEAKPAAEHKSDVEVVTRAVYRANGNPGYVDNDHHTHIFTVAVPGSD